MVDEIPQIYGVVVERSCQEDPFGGSICRSRKGCGCFIFSYNRRFPAYYFKNKGHHGAMRNQRGDCMLEKEAVWFKGKRFIPTVWAGTAGEEQIKHLRPALDSKGKKVYHEASAKAKLRVLELLRGLSSELQSKINILIFASVLIVIAKALFSHNHSDCCKPLKNLVTSKLFNVSHDMERMSLYLVVLEFIADVLVKNQGSVGGEG
ncbi:DNA mismatch repair ATPase msh1 [Datura stramonium]|uniref:DNA mismatch repair ATPase msh1 n=1 Tax=Datura stramonium TaxID=4076 RepID=A0ABS8UKW1_DATST|nr:DNA mismatch repair ATPase msh1 [Datura stramonium]